MPNLKVTKATTTYQELATSWAEKEQPPKVRPAQTAHDRRNWLRKQAGWPRGN